MLKVWSTVSRVEELKNDFEIFKNIFILEADEKKNYSVESQKDLVWLLCCTGNYPLVEVDLSWELKWIENRVFKN